MSDGLKVFLVFVLLSVAWWGMRMAYSVGELNGRLKCYQEATRK